MVTSAKTRMAMFLIGCIGVRLLFVFAAKKATPGILQYMGIAALFIAIGFVVINKYGLRKTGSEAGGVIWWDDLRPLHAIMYTSFAILAFTNNKYAWVPLLIDVFIGLGAYIAHHRK